jgi:hypothetical protein
VSVASGDGLAGGIVSAHETTRVPIGRLERIDYQSLTTSVCVYWFGVFTPSSSYVVTSHAGPDHAAVHPIARWFASG